MGTAAGSAGMLLPMDTTTKLFRRGRRPDRPPRRRRQLLPARRPAPPRATTSSAVSYRSRCWRSPVWAFPRLRGGARGALALFLGSARPSPSESRPSTTPATAAPQATTSPGSLMIPAGLAPARPRCRDALADATHGRRARLALRAPRVARHRRRGRGVRADLPDRLRLRDDPRGPRGRSREPARRRLRERLLRDQRRPRR